ncbi:MAG: hypothetical protein KatS3mg104_1744 [Phycisphaerae bacterium]|nr:MAG: hypothetical protein KatS3mg104_1744 [Phycisphaerae bacterium]
MTTAIFLAGGMSFVISFLLTRIIISIAPRIGFVDKPGHRKIHHQPKPLGGGVAIVWTYVLMLLGGGLVFASTDLLGHPIEPLQQGLIQQRPLLFAFVAGILLLHVMGLMDDKRVWGPYLKLSIQLLVTASLVAFAEFYAQSTPSLRLRVLTALDDLTGSSVPSFVITILWIVAITNAFNFLDNMDGLSAGVAVICGTAFYGHRLVHRSTVCRRGLSGFSSAQRWVFWPGIFHLHGFSWGIQGHWSWVSSSVY